MSELQEQFPEEIVAQSVDATTPESQQICKDLGFNNHGLVIRSPEGETLWSQPDHRVVVDEARAFVEEQIKKR